LLSEEAIENMSAHEESLPQATPESSKTEAPPPSEVSEIERLQQALAEAEERANAVRDQYLRALADLDNVRKRAQREIESAHKYGLEKFAQELLPVMDSLHLAVQNAATADAASLAAGQEATLRLLAKAFEKLGITELNPVGEPFNPEEHEAMMTQESSTAEPNSVLQVIQRGYGLNGRLLRPARVIVAKAPGEQNPG
jgi:molecular chaperone GrpE